MGFYYFAIRAGCLLIFWGLKDSEKLMKHYDGSKQKLAEVYVTQNAIASSI